MSDAIAVERAAAADLDDVAPLFDAYRVFYRETSDPKGARAFIGTRLAAGDSTIFIARIGGRACGFVQLYPLFSSSRMQRLWLLGDLFVAPEARKNGIGSALIKVAEGFARADGAAGLTLSTATNNHTAQSLYEASGYTRDDDFLVYNLEF
jgi:ribosomal protein S18 acetylase RimI-like enzyme